MVFEGGVPSEVGNILKSIHNRRQCGIRYKKTGKKMMKLMVFLMGVGLAVQCAAYTNVIVVMADDFGFECVETYGGESYSTPRMNQLAIDGVKFDNAHSQPICTPSRVQIMTGKYNVRNYTKFATLDQSQDTFGHPFRAAGYATCVVGKWQLGGTS